LGNIAFNTPDTLEFGDSEMIQLLLSKQESIQDLQDKIGAAGEKEGARIRISSQMQARLSGSGFGIEPVTPEIQAVSGTEATEWIWEIKPTEEGNQRLHLTLSVLLSVDGERTPRAVRTLERAIDIRVTSYQRVYGFVANNWQWLWTTILIPLWIGTMSKFRKASTTHTSIPSMAAHAFVRRRCPHCRKKLSIPATLCGKTIKCPNPNCRKSMYLPSR
jgi:hypothetical protein